MAAVAPVKQAESKSQSTWALAWRRFRKHRAAMFSLGVIAVLVFVALTAPLIAPYSPTTQPTGTDLAACYNKPPLSPPSCYPGATFPHLMGTDDLGRDLFTRIMYGARISLMVGFIAAFMSAIIGSLLGVIAGYFAGRPLDFYYGPLAKGAPQTPLFWAWRVASWAIYFGFLFFVGQLIWTLSGKNVQALLGGAVNANNVLSSLGFVVGFGALIWGGIFGFSNQLKLDLDNVVSRFMDFILTIPELPLLLVLSALLRDTQGALGRWFTSTFGESASVLIIITIIVLFGWVGTGRLVRGAVLSLREQEFTTAAQALGAGSSRIMFRHLVPNTLAPLIVNTTLAVGGAIITESALSFLGFGIQPPVATWGNMLTNAQQYLFDYPWLALFPGFMIFLTVLSFNYLGDGLRDALDPRSRL